MRISDELFAPVSPGIELCYQTFGDPDDEPLLLVMGLGGPMTWWNPDLCTLLAGKGFFVIRYDNRDCGRSSRAKGRVTRGMLVRGFTGRAVRPPYTMADLADDGFRLLDHLGIESAHLCGVSMGGMIVQTMACTHPQRVRSLTSIMSTLGKRSVGWQDPKLLPMLLAPRHAGREAYVETSSRMWKLIGSPDYPEDPESVRERAGETFDRGVSTSGVLRQMLAIVTQPNRARQLARTAAPGAGDPWRLRPDGARVRWPGDRPGDPGRRADPGQGHGPRHAGGATTTRSPTASAGQPTGSDPPRDRGTRTRPGRSSSQWLPATRSAARRWRCRRRGRWTGRW